KFITISHQTISNKNSVPERNQNGWKSFHMFELGGYLVEKFFKNFLRTIHFNHLKLKSLALSFQFLWTNKRKAGNLLPAKCGSGNVHSSVFQNFPFFPQLFNLLPELLTGFIILIRKSGIKLTNTRCNFFAVQLIMSGNHFLPGRIMFLYLSICCFCFLFSHYLPSPFSRSSSSDSDFTIVCPSFSRLIFPNNSPSPYNAPLPLVKSISFISFPSISFQYVS